MGRMKRRMEKKRWREGRKDGEGGEKGGRMGRVERRGRGGWRKGRVERREGKAIWTDRWLLHGCLGRFRVYLFIRNS